MKVLVRNSFWTLQLTLTALYWTGFWSPTGNEAKKSSYLPPFFSFMFVVGIYIIVQFGDLCQVWGDVSLMTGTSFLLFTNMSLGLKMFNLVYRKEAIGVVVDDAEDELSGEDTERGKVIVKRCDREVNLLFYIYSTLSYITIAGWATSAPKDQLPMRAWYPYDTAKSPAYELTYMYQIVAVTVGATVNISLDTLVTSLMAQCSCRLQLLALRLRTLGEDMVVGEKKLYSPSQMEVLCDRLRRCIMRHQAVLGAARRLQQLFSASILAQVTVSMVIICVTAYQLAFESKDVVRLVSMVAYLLCMVLQLFQYCYQGNQLSVESSVVSGVAYEMPWYQCTAAFRRDLLTLMTRTQREVKVSAAGLTTLSLSAFMSIIKASYTFFTVLRSVEES